MQDQSELCVGSDGVPPTLEFVKHILWFAQLVGLLWMVYRGDKAIRAVGYKGPLPGIYWTIADNSFPCCIFVYLLAPQIVRTLYDRYTPDDTHDEMAIIQE